MNKTLKVPAEATPSHVVSGGKGPGFGLPSWLILTQVAASAALLIGTAALTLTVIDMKRTFQQSELSRINAVSSASKEIEARQPAGREHMTEVILALTQVLSKTLDLQVLQTKTAAADRPVSSSETGAARDDRAGSSQKSAMTAPDTDAVF